MGIVARAGHNLLRALMPRVMAIVSRFATGALVHVRTWMVLADRSVRGEGLARRETRTPAHRNRQAGHQHLMMDPDEFLIWRNRELVVLTAVTRVRSREVRAASKEIAETAPRSVWHLRSVRAEREHL